MKIRFLFAMLFLLVLGTLTVLAQEEPPPPLVFATNTPKPSPTPEPADYIRSERLGITFVGSADIPYREERYTRALELGAGWNRFPVYWDRVETEPGAFTWDAFDSAIEQDVQHGMNTNLILLGAPSFRRDADGRLLDLDAPIFADGTDRPGTVDAPKRINPDNPWARFVHAAGVRYRPGGTLARENGWTNGEGITVWEVWNEPDYPLFWQSSIRDYARLLKISYLVLHQIDPDATVMVGGLTYVTDVNWLAQIMAIHINDPLHEDYDWFMDAVAVHSYGNPWRSGWLVLYARQTLIEYGVEKPIWLNESGIATWEDYPGPTWAADIPSLREVRGTNAQQAAYFVQSTAWAFAEGAEVVFYHQLYDDCGDEPPGSNFPPHDGDLCVVATAEATEEAIFSGESPLTRYENVCFGSAFGIYRNAPDSVCFAQHPEPNTPRPVADAYRMVAEVFGAAPFSRRGAVQELFDLGVTAITFVRPQSNERIVVVWNTTLDDTTFALPAFGSRATLHTLDGTRTVTPDDGAYTLDLPGGEPDNNPYAREWENTTIGGNPVILVERIENEPIARELLTETGEVSAAVAVEPTAVPGASVSDAEAAELVATSPTGVVFVSLNVSRIRTRPDTSAASRVLGNINPGQAATVIGRTPDGSWLLLDFNEREVWVAAFLGELYGSDTDIAALRAVPYPPTPTPES